MKKAHFFITIRYFDEVYGFKAVEIKIVILRVMVQYSFGFDWKHFEGTHFLSLRG
jgi:hypothetical protein